MYFIILMNIYQLNNYFNYINNINKSIINNINININNNLNMKIIIIFFINFNLKFYKIINNVPIVLDKQIIDLKIIQIKNNIINKLILLIMSLSNNNYLFSDIKDSYNEHITHLTTIDKILNILNINNDILNNIFASNINNNTTYIAEYSN